MVTGRALHSMGAAFWNDLSPAYFLEKSEELATSVYLYTLIAWVQFSEIGTYLVIMEPCYGEPCMSSTILWTQSAPVFATNDVDEGLSWYVHMFISPSIGYTDVFIEHFFNEQYGAIITYGF